MTMLTKEGRFSKVVLRDQPLQMRKAINVKGGLDTLKQPGQLEPASVKKEPQKLVVIAIIAVLIGLYSPIQK